MYEKLERVVLAALLLTTLVLATNGLFRVVLIDGEPEPSHEEKVSNKEVNHSVLLLTEKGLRAHASNYR